MRFPVLRHFPCLLICLICAAAHAATESSVELLHQREQFPLLYEAAQRGPADAWRKLAIGMENYPLFPYLELAALQHRSTALKRSDVDAFLAAWPHTLPAKILRENFLFDLAKRSQWKDFLDLYDDETHGRELTCDALQARLALGLKLNFETDIKPIWLVATALPSACDGATSWAKQQGKLTAAVIWQRIDLAAHTGNADLIGALAAMLDDPDRTSAQRLAAAIHDPSATLTQAPSWTDTAHAREATTLALERLARHNEDEAQAGWEKLTAHFHFDTDQRGRVLRALALYHAASYGAGALAKLAALPAELADDSTREWRVRSALAAQDFPATLAALEALSAEQKTDPRWRYLHARVLVKLDRKDQATPLFEALSQEANFHGFLAADWLDRPYTICTSQLPKDGVAEELVQKHAGLARAFEFFALNRLPEARREWEFTLATLTPAQRRLAAERASQLGWYDRAVYTFSQGDDLHLYELRFPLARREQIERAAIAAGIDPSFAYGIIRAESAWTTDAHSTADAYGLMQLLPGTAAQIAKAIKFAYVGTHDLFNPDSNIVLGTRFLGSMAAHFDGSPLLASAAYNAGPDPIGRWIGQRDALDPDFFVETIPYKETREYVSRVLAFSVIYDWRLHGSAQALSARMPRIGHSYTLPTDDAPRKQVVCPASMASTTPAALIAPISSSAK